MGVEYVLVDKGRKVYYYLGKGGWFHLDDMEAFHDKEYLAHEVKHECYYWDDETYWSSKLPNHLAKKEVEKYLDEKVIPELYECFKESRPEQLEIINDCTDDLYYMKCKGYRCIGTRYTDETIDDRNKHFLPERRHMYRMDSTIDPTNKF